jgi:ribosomal protein S18 acetylase RimI-like enzyme
MTLKNIQIRAVQRTDLKTLQEIGKSTFAETFVDDCDPLDMEKYLEEKHNFDLLKFELENPESQFFFAEIENNVVAYLKINWGKAQTESKLKNAFEMERLYVLSDFQRMKVGQVLMDKALVIASERNFEWLWLGVWENNTKAIRFYKKNGFVIFDKHPFVVGTDVQTDVLMKRNLFKD